jgi:uncharacterized peroxidase-related enzyme
MGYLGDGGLTEDNFPLFAAMKRKEGLILDYWRVQGLRPDILEKEVELFGIAIVDGALTEFQKQHIAVAVSGHVMSTYCATAHSEALRAMGVSNPDLDQLGVDHRYAGLSDADVALLDFSVKLTERPEKMGPEDIARLRQFGFNDTQIFEAVFIASFLNFANRISLGLGAVPDFKPVAKVRAAR